MAGKRAQIAIFLIALIILIALFGIITILAQQTRKGATLNPGTQGEVDSLKQYVQSCLDLTSKNAVWLAGRYGGYVYPLYPPKLQTDYGFFVYDYEYLQGVDFENGVVYLPSLEDIEDSISTYVSNEIVECVDLTQFEQKGYSVKREIPRATTKIAENNVIVELDYPIELTKDNKKIRIENFKTTVNVRLKAVYNRSQEIIQAVGLSDAEGDAALIGEIGQTIYNQPKFSINFLFYIPNTEVSTSDDAPFHIIPDTKLSNVPVKYTFMPDHLSTLWIVEDAQAKPSYLFIFATKHRQVIE